MLVIGLTGGSGCGKNEVAKILSERGIFTVDTDRVYHDIVSSDCQCTRELASAFGNSVLNTDGSLSRPRLAEIVFSDDGGREERMKRLGEIAHRYIRAETDALLKKEREKGAILSAVDAPVLFESGFSSFCDTTLAVLASKEKRLSRIMARDGISEDAALKRLLAQPSDSFYIERADFIIYNNGSLDDLVKEVDAWLIQIKQKNNLR